MSSIGMLRYGKICTGKNVLDVFLGYSFKSLDRIRRNLNMRSEDYINKSELARIIGKKVESGFRDRISCLDYERYSILKSITEGGNADELCDARSLFSFVISEIVIECNSDREETYALPVELFNVFKELDSPAMIKTVKQNSEIYKLINGCMISYGLIDLIKLNKIINGHLNYELDDEEFRKTLDGCELVHGMILTNWPLVISRSMEPKTVQYFKDEQAKVPDFDYKELTKEELVLAADLEYVPEIPCYWKLMNLLKRYFKCDEKLCKNSVAILINYAKACRDIEDTMKYIVQELGLLTGEFIGEFMPLYCEYNNCTGKWALKGYTPDEITKICNPELYEKAQSMKNRDEGPGRVLPFKVNQLPPG